MADRETFTSGRENFMRGREIFMRGRENFARGREIFMRGLSHHGLLTIDDVEAATLRSSNLAALKEISHFSRPCQILMRKKRYAVYFPSFCGSAQQKAISGTYFGSYDDGKKRSAT